MTVTQNQIPVTVRLIAEINIRRAGRAATDLLPKGTPVPFIIALTNEMLQQASTVYSTATSNVRRRRLGMRLLSRHVAQGRSLVRKRQRQSLHTSGATRGAMSKHPRTHNAIRQAEYREAVKLHMTVPEYRAYIAAGRQPAPYVPNKGWDSLWVARAAKARMHGDKACHQCGYKGCACAEIAKHYPEYAAVTPPVPKAQETSVTPPEPVTKPTAVKPTYCNRDHHHFASCYSPEGMTVDWPEVRPATEQELNQYVVKRI